MDCEILITLISNDIEKLTELENGIVLKQSLLNAIVQALDECNTMSKMVHDADDFYNANITYITCLGIYAELLSKEKLDKEATKEYIDIFSVLLAKLFRTARSITESTALETILPGYLWTNDIVNALANKDEN